MYLTELKTSKTNIIEIEHHCIVDRMFKIKILSSSNCNCMPRSSIVWL